MSNQRYTPEFKDEAARQIVDRGYSVAEVSERLGVSAHRLFAVTCSVPFVAIQQPAGVVLVGVSLSASARRTNRSQNEFPLKRSVRPF